MKTRNIITSLLLLFFLGLSQAVYSGNKAKVFPQIQYGFIENKGQLHNQDGELNTEVKYLLPAYGINVQLKQNGYSLEMNSGDTGEVKFHRIDISFEGANANCLLLPELMASDYINYYINYTRQAGVPAGNGQTYVRHYGKVTYKEVYPNIDIEFLMDKSSGKVQYKYNIIARPGAELERVRFTIKGAKDIEINTKGNLIYKTSLGQIEEAIPYSYRLTEANTKETVKSSFQLLNKETLGFVTKIKSNQSLLVIDPIGWATYYGGASLNSNISYSHCIGSNNAGTFVLGGITYCTTGIATTGAYLGSRQGAIDGFLAKFTTNGVLLWGSYYGGLQSDFIECLGVDSFSNIYIGGSTYSNSGIATPGTFISNKGGSILTGFLGKFDSNGFFSWGTYLGDSTMVSSSLEILDIDILDNSTISMVGTVHNTINLATIGTHSLIQSGAIDIIIFSFNTNGSRKWTTYFGGPLNERRPSIEITKSNEIIISGITSSDSGIATVGAHKVTRQGIDGFIAKFDSTGNRIWGTYFGGASNDTIFNVDLDSTGNIYVCGSTASTAGIATTGAYLASNSPQLTRAFVNKFNSQGVRQWGTYYTGNIYSSAREINLDVNGNIVIAGNTNSTTGIATPNTNQTSLNGAFDVFLAKFNPSGTNRLWGTYFGGNQIDYVHDLYINAFDEILITGPTNSMTGLSTAGAHQTTNQTTNSSPSFPNVNNFSIYIALFSPNGGLPVTWSSFEAMGQKRETEVLANLLWSTASETNNAYFTIERSDDAKLFEPIDEVKGKGNSARMIHYTFTDNLPLHTQEVYYRIKQSDFDGKHSYSEIRKLSFSTENAEENYHVFYQGNKLFLGYKGITQENASLSLVNLLGQTVWQGSFDTENSFIYPIPYQGQVGVYLLKISSKGEEKCIKVVLE